MTFSLLYFSFLLVIPSTAFSFFEQRGSISLLPYSSTGFHRTGHGLPQEKLGHWRRTNVQVAKTCIIVLLRFFTSKKGARFRRILWIFACTSRATSYFSANWVTRSKIHFLLHSSYTRIKLLYLAITYTPMTW